TNIEILCLTFLQELDDNPICALRLRQAVKAMAGLRNDDVSAVGQVKCDLFAALRRRHWIHVAGKKEDRNIRRNRLTKVGRYFALWPDAAGPRLLKHAIVPEWIARVQLGGFLLINKGNVFSTGHGKVHPVGDEIRDGRTNCLAQKRPEIALCGVMDN